MAQFVTCPRGHPVEWPDGKALPETVTEIDCPVCNVYPVPPPPRAELSAAERLKNLLAAELADPLTAKGVSTGVTRTGHPPEPAAPPTVEGYRDLTELGRGGMGVVYRALHVRLNRTVALKMMLAGAHASAAERARLRAEAEAVARLQHPNIVQIFEVGEQDDRPFLALEYVEGGSLHDRLKGNPLPATVSAELLESLARAIHYAHQHGVVHRDLKPANILLGGVRGQGSGVSEGRGVSEETKESGAGDQTRLVVGVAKITDFGLAKQLDASVGQTATGAVLGTPSYMAPEQAGGKSKEIGPAVDIYALGAILYEMLTGRPPFRAASAIETLDLVRNQEAVSPRSLQPRLPRDLETVCLKCLAKEPRKRYVSAEDLAEDLRRFRSGEPIQARPVSRWERLGKWARRNPGWAALGVFVFLGIVAAAAGGVHLYRLNISLDKSSQQAARQQDVAVANLFTALDAFEHLMPHMHPQNLGRVQVDAVTYFRAQFLIRATQFYEKLLADRDNPDPKVQRGCGRAYYGLGMVHFMKNEFGEAQPLFEQAVALQDRLTRAFPDEPGYRYELARSYEGQGDLFKAMKDHDKEAVDAPRRAMTVPSRIGYAGASLPWPTRCGLPDGKDVHTVAHHKSKMDNFSGSMASEGHNLPGKTSFSRD
jgi:serine/threonine protein kinase